MTLEDEFCDIVKKARFGQKLSLEKIAEEGELSVNDLEQLEKGVRPPSVREVEAISRTLQLRTEPLVQIAIEAWTPSPPALPEHAGQVVTVEGDIGGYAVKGYLLYDSDTKDAVLIDTAYNAEKMLQEVKQRGLQVRGVCLTHGHTDHAGGLDRILAEWPVPVYLGRDDVSLLSWRPPQDHLSEPKDHQTLSVGNLMLEFLATPGHTPGGFCFRLTHKGSNLCFVGDTLFAGSIGRSNPFSLYPSHLHSVREHVLQLPLDCALLPGHGPATTVKQELEHNPFR